MPKVAPEIRIASLTIDKRLKVPLYQQLFDGVRSAIINGMLRPGQRLPATRTLCAELGISRNMVSKAFDQLTIEGYLKPAVGSGTYVSDVLPETYIQSEQSITGTSSSAAPQEVFDVANPFMSPRNMDREKIIPFQNAVPALDMFPYKVWSSIASGLYRRMEDLPLGYDDAAGYLPLRGEIASYVATFRGVKCTPENVLVVNGTQQALSIIASGLIKEDDQVLVEDPGYAGAKAALMHVKARICPVPVEHDGANIDYAMSHYEKPRCFYVTPAHQYPLGGALSVSKRSKLLNWAQNTGAWILEDDYDSELRYVGKPLPALRGSDSHGRVIYIGSFSKVLFPGLRIGYIVFPSKEMTQHFAKIKALFDRQTPIMEQAIVAQFIRDGHFFRHLRKMRLIYSERQQLLLKAIAKDIPDFLSAEPQETGMHLVAWLNKDCDDRAISAVLEREGIVANALSDYVLHFKQRPALILGYTAFNKFKLRHHVIRMGQILSKHLQ